MTPLERAIELAGGVGALASAIGVAPSAPSMWKTRGNVPAEHCPAIERATAGGVRCEDLRPDVAWEVLREQSSGAVAAVQ
jgi:DNA-binding transcriptional regulator YdaS (Cro superfamily)